MDTEMSTRIGVKADCLEDLSEFVGWSEGAITPRPSAPSLVHAADDLLFLLRAVSGTRAEGRGTWDCCSCLEKQTAG